MIKFVIMTVAALAMLWLGIRSLRTRAWEDHISPIEAIILKTTGAEPLPITDADKDWGRAQAWLMVLFGSLVTAIGIFVIGISLFEAE